MDITQRLFDQVVSRLEDASIPDAPKHDANRILGALSTDIDMAVADGGYEDFVLTYLGKEVERFHADPEDLAEGEKPRTDPLCTCDRRYCALKQGQLPIDIRRASSLSAGIREFKSTHDGTPVVLDEAHQEYRETVAHVRQGMADIIHLLSNQVAAREAGIEPGEYGLDEGTFAPVPEDRDATASARGAGA